jgi:hypothetical protein
LSEIAPAREVVAGTSCVYKFPSWFRRGRFADSDGVLRSPEIGAGQGVVEPAHRGIANFRRVVGAVREPPALLNKGNEPLPNPFICGNYSYRPDRFP